MAPPHLSLLPTPRHFSFINGAIASSASPLQTNFNLSCRSPGQPKSDPDPSEIPSRNSRSGVVTGKATSNLQFEAVSKRRGSASLGRAWPSSLLSPTEHSWIHSQTSPGLPIPPTPCVTPKQDEGKLGVVSAINIIVGKTIGVGAYSVPAAVFEGVGSVGMALAMWALGSLISFCGMAVYLELGTAMPKSGGERVYLERIFRRPRMLATCMFMAYAVLLGFSTPNAIVMGEYVLYSAGVSTNRWNVRAIAVLSVTLLCYIHARHPRLGLRLINVLGTAKLLMLVLVVMSGIAGALMGVGSRTGELMGHHIDPDMQMGISTARRNFQDIWVGSSCQPYDYATALLKVVYCFRGYSTANQVLSDVKDPVRTLRVAMPLALTLVSVIYMAVNVAFFLVVDKEEFRSAGVMAAGLLFRNVFGNGAGAHVLPLFVIVSAAGNIAATSFAQARVNEELAKDGLLPLSGLWTSHHSPGATSRPPTRGLLLHWAVSVAVIVFPPPGKIYSFLVDLGGYPVLLISVSIAGGLLYLHDTPSEQWQSPWPAPRLAVFVFAGSNCLLLVLPWIPPAGGHGENERYAYYAYPGTALGVLTSGALYWCWWRTRGNGSGKKDSQETGEQASNRGSSSWFSASRWDKLRSAIGRMGRRGGIEEGYAGPSDASSRLLSGEDDGSEPMGHISVVRRRAPCGCPCH